MKTDRITKLYEDLTNKERAALCYRYQMDDNDVEVARIIATVPRKAYEGADEEFKGWLISFSVMANVWAINHWKLYSRHLAATGGFVYHAGRNEFDQAWVWDQAFTYWETHLLALDRALEAVCERHGFDVDCARQLAGTAPFVPLRAEATPDAEFQAEVEAQLSAVLNRVRH